MVKNLLKKYLFTNLQRKEEEETAGELLRHMLYLYIFIHIATG